MSSPRQLLDRARARARSVMIDTCVAERPTTGALDTQTGLPAVSWAVVYTGVCRVRSLTAANATAVERNVPEAGEQITARPVLLLPWDAAGAASLTVGDRVVCNTVVYTVVSRLMSTTATARAYAVEEVQP